MNNIDSKKEELLQNLSSVSEQAELFCIQEDSSNISLIEGALSTSQNIQTNSFISTSISKGKLLRNSWALDTNQTELFDPKLEISKLDFSLGENQTYDLNPSNPSIQIEPIMDTLPLQSLQDIADEYYEALSSRWLDFKINVFLESLSTRSSIQNSHGLKGAYERHTIRSTIGMCNKLSGRDVMYRNPALETPKSLIERLEPMVDKLYEPLPMTYLKGGSGPVLLSPSVVGLICLKISSYLRDDFEWSAHVSNALPKDFELIEDPLLEGGVRYSPFDDEGTLTKKKILCRGAEKISSINNLSLSGQKKVRPTGNGYRRGTYFEKPVDLTPSPLPSQLMLTPRKTKMKDIVEQHDELVFIDHVVVPFNQIFGSDTKESLFFFGRILNKGKEVYNVRGQLRALHSMVSSMPPGSHGSLIDSSAIILNEGNLYDLGWFPHIFLKKVTW